MIPPWAAAYIGIPWREKGRDREGCDCWGLVTLVMREQFGLDLPSYAHDYTDTSEREQIAALLADGIPATGWGPVVGVPRAGDGVVFRLMNAPWHVGLMVDAESFVHVEEGVGASCLERLDSYRWARRQHGIFRHRALAAVAG